MEKLILLLIIASIAVLLCVGTLLLALYVILCEYYELKFHYLTPKKSGMVNKSSGYSSATITHSAISGGGGGGGRNSPGNSGSSSRANVGGVDDSAGNGNKSGPTNQTKPTDKKQEDQKIKEQQVYKNL